MGLLETIPFLQEILLFVLAYVVIFAILQKSKILGDDVKQINALVSLVIAILFVGVSSATNIVSKIIPWATVIISLILLFLLLFGFVGGEIGQMPSWLKWTIIGVSFVILVGIVIYFTGLFDFLKTKFHYFDSSYVYTIIVLILVVGGIIYAIKSSK